MKLEIGDIVFKYHFGKLVAKYKVTHVTKTQAAINLYGQEPDSPKDGIRLRREYSVDSGLLRLKGRNPYSTDSYYIYTEERETAWQKTLYLNAIKSKLRLEDLSLEELQALYNRTKSDDHVLRLEKK